MTTLAPRTHDHETGTSPLLRSPVALRIVRSGVLLIALAEAGFIALLALALVAPAPAQLDSARALAITVEIDDSTSARSIANALPASVVFDDRMGAALVAEDVAVGGPLTSTGEVADYRVGDIVWWPVRRELIVFTRDGSETGGAALVRVGTVRSGLAGLQNCVLECDVTVSSRGARPASR